MQMQEVSSAGDGITVIVQELVWTAGGNEVVKFFMDQQKREVDLSA